MQSASHSIPHVDMRQYDENFDAFTKAVGNGYEQYGFIALTQHGVDPDLIDRALDTCRDLFALPEDVKKQYHRPGQGGARGYTPFGTEIAKDAKHVDLKEFWHVGREVEGEPKYPQLLPNVWPQELPEFKRDMTAVYRELDKLGNKVLDAIAGFFGAATRFLPR